MISFCPVYEIYSIVKKRCNSIWRSFYNLDKQQKSWHLHQPDFEWRKDVLREIEKRHMIAYLKTNSKKFNL